MLPTRESLTVEFKSDIKPYPNPDIFEDVVAFANTEGGELYLGIEDSGKVTGVHKTHSDPTTLSAYIANNTVPPVPIRAEIIDDVYPVLCIYVPKSSYGITATASGKVLHRRTKADGTPENVAMYPIEFATRLSDLRMMDYSALPVELASTDDFDPVEVANLRRLITAYNGDKSLLELTNEDLYKALGFVREMKGISVPTITGLLMVGKLYAIERFIPTYKTAFQVLEGTDVRLNEDFTIPLLSAIDKLNTYMAAWNPEQELEFGLFRASVPAFNKRAVREAIVNAFSHRDYTKMGRVRVAISDEGLTVSNPGGFVEGVSIANLLTAEPHGRNPQLADALKRIGLAERTGRGIDRIFEGSLIYGNALPDYSASTSVMVSLFIPRSNPDPQIAELVSNEQNRLGRPLSVNTLLVLNMLKDMPKSSSSQVAEAVNITESAAKAILDKSVEIGIIEPYGTGRSRTYMLSPKVYSTKRQKVGFVLQSDIDEARYQELILKLAKKSDYISRADVVQLLHVEENKAYRLLKKLVDADRLFPVNKGRYAKYKYKE